MDIVTEELIARQLRVAQAIIRLLLAEIAKLKEQWAQNPGNSSKPPSSEHPSCQAVEASA